MAKNGKTIGKTKQLRGKSRASRKRPALKTPREIKVSGIVKHRADNKITAGCRVNAYVRTPEGDILMGTGMTDSLGKYQVRIAQSITQLKKDHRVDLVLRALEAD